jgi:Co/Zn/Cd efflux system component
MSMMDETFPRNHNHIFLGEGHEQNERRTWMVIALCSCMMVAEIVGGLLYGSIALVADGLHMSTHASALLLAALAYSYARRHANDSRFTLSFLSPARGCCKACWSPKGARSGVVT